MSLTPSTLCIVYEFCQKFFGLDPEKEYFIKIGTYSSKFDFRNAHVSGEKEVRELGEYLLFIHFQALCMAHYDLSCRNQPCVYGVSTTTEWVVREYIQPKPGAKEIYFGLPLRPEYRIFVDFDFDYHKLAERTWDNEILSYVAQIHEHKSNNWMMHLQSI